MNVLKLILLAQALSLAVKALDASIAVYAEPAQPSYQYYLDGKNQLARKQAEDSIRLDPGNWTLWRVLALIELSETNHLAAREAVQKAYLNGDEGALCALVGLNLKLGKTADATRLISHLKYYVTNEFTTDSDRVGAAIYLASYYKEKHVNVGELISISKPVWSRLEAGVEHLSLRRGICEQLDLMERLGVGLPFGKFGCEPSKGSSSNLLFRPFGYDVYLPLFPAASVDPGTEGGDPSLALKADPNRRLISLLDMGNSTEAIEELEELSKKRPNYHLVWYSLGMIRAARKEYDKAISAYEKAAGLGDAVALYNLSLIARYQKDYENPSLLISLLQQNRDNTWLQSSSRWKAVFLAISLAQKYDLPGSIPHIIRNLPPMKEVSAIPRFFLYSDKPAAGDEPTEEGNAKVLEESLGVIKELEKSGNKEAASKVRLHCAKNL